MTPFRKWVWAVVWITGCASTSSSTGSGGEPPPAEKPTPDKPAEPPSESEQKIAREKTLSQLVLDTNLLDLPEEKRLGIRAQALADLAQVRFELGQADAAMKAIDDALECAEGSNSPKILRRVVNDRYLIYRFTALEAAKARDYDKSLKLFDKMTLAKNLSTDQRNQLGGDRLMVIEMRGDKEERTRNAALASALSRMLGTTTAEPTQNFEQSAEDLRAAIGRQMGKVVSSTDIGHTELPETDIPITDRGVVDQRVVLEVVSANKKSISTCYSQALKGGNVIRGRLEIEAKIKPTGEVFQSNIQNGKLANQPLARCIADAVMRWRFPPFVDAEDHSVVLPFILDAFF